MAAGANPCFNNTSPRTATTSGGSAAPSFRRHVYKIRSRLFLTDGKFVWKFGNNMNRDYGRS